LLTEKIIDKYLLCDNLSTYDPYDIWKTDIGLKIKRLYYKHKYLGLLPAGILNIYDFYLNNSFRVGYKKQEFPVVRAFAILALLNLYKTEPKDIYLKYAKKHIDWLLNNSSSGYSGYCWGTGFEIVISDELSYDKSVPFSTNTPYILEALFEYFKVTNDSEILEVIKSIYQFYEKDLIVLKESDEVLIISYAPFKDRVVTNAVSYTMFAYSIFYQLLDEKEYIRDKIMRMYNFISTVQQCDGSWFYAPYNSNSFIDCFHTAFVLKNIIKTRKNGIEIDSDRVLVKGYRYIKESFYEPKERLYKRFSISNKPSIVKFDLYDNAEMLYLAKLMSDNRVIEELEKSISKFMDRDAIYSVLDLFGFRKNRDTLRWAVMPYILAKSL
jgi:hypothetical protein